MNETIKQLEALNLQLLAVRDQLTRVQWAPEHVNNGPIGAHLNALEASLSDATGRIGTLRDEVAFVSRACGEAPAERQYRVAAVSSNTNAFGLHEVVAISRTGASIRFLYNQLTPMKAGSLLRLNVSGETPDFPSLCLCVPASPTASYWSRVTVECPRVSDRAPLKVVREVWNEGRPM